jgi:TRAP-type mannitol/chloroaromatic compound transport system permease small subunit
MACEASAAPFLAPFCIVVVFFGVVVLRASRAFWDMIF